MNWFEFTLGLVLISQSVSCKTQNLHSIFENTTTLSTYTIAQAITQHSYKSFENSFICSNQVFVFHDKFEFDYKGTEASLTISYFPLVLKKFKVNGIPENLEFFNREVKEIDILESLVFGVLRYSRNCVSVFIETSSASQAQTLTNYVLASRFARPSNDYFFYIGVKEWIDSFAESFFGNDIRYKFGIFKSPGQAFGFSLTNYCGNYNSDDLFSLKCDQILNGKFYKASTVSEPSVARYMTKNGVSKWTGGICFHLLSDAATQYNFTFSITWSVSTGAKDSLTGKWKGAIGDVFNRDADIGLCTGFSIDRHYIVDPSISVSWYSRVFYIQSPSTRTSWKSVFWPLSTIVWILIILFTISIIPLFIFTRKKECANDLNQTIIEAFTTTMEIILEQSTKTVKTWRGFRLRSLLMFWTFFCLVIGTGYRSKLVSFLTFLEKEQVPRTHQELSLSDYKIYFRYYGGIAYAASIQSPLPMHKRLMKRAILVNSSRDCILAAGLIERAACLDYQFPADYNVATNATLFPHRKNEFFIRSKDQDISVSNIWSFRKGSPLRQTFDKILLSRIETGLYDRWLEEDWLKSKILGAEWLMKQNKNPIKLKMEQVLQETSAYPKSLNISSLIGTFGILISGLILGTLVWVTETLVKMYNMNKLLKYK